MGDYQSARQAPTVDPGQIWLIEQNSASPICGLDRDALTNVNVVIYDRALAPLVSQVLPIGGYAEPMPVRAHTAGPAILPRAFELAEEGWSVAQLVEASASRRSRIPLLPPTLTRATRSGAFPVRLIAKTAADRCRVVDLGLRELTEVLCEFGEDELFTLVLGPLVSARAAHPHAFAANGLAG